MAKRYTDTDKWNDDWYVSLSNDYRIIWQWLLDNCNHAGICKRSLSILNRDCNTNVSEQDIADQLCGRLVIRESIWFIPKFLKFQYPNIGGNKPAIISVVKELRLHNLYEMIRELFGNDYLIIKDKDKDKDKDTDGTVGTLEGEAESETVEQGDWNEGVFMAKVRASHYPNFGAVCFQFTALNGKHEQAVAFFNHYESTGWMKSGHPIVHWQPMVGNWLSRDAEKTKPDKPGKSPPKQSTFTPQRENYTTDAEYDFALKQFNQRNT